MSREILLTRVFILILVVCSLSAGFYVLFSVETVLITIKNPTLVTYQQLYNQSGNDLQCPCSQLSIPYRDIFNIQYTLHQVCSSDFVSFEWLHYVASFDSSLLPEWKLTDSTSDFRVIGVSYFEFLATFCSLARININDTQHVFNNTMFV